MTDKSKAMDRLIAQDADLIDTVHDRMVLAVRELLTDDSHEHAGAFAAFLREAFTKHGLTVEKKQ